MGLSILELFLLVALFRLRRKGIEPANFEMAFDEYSSLRRGGSYRGVDETAPRPSAFRAYERLLSASLVSYTDSRYPAVPDNLFCDCMVSKLSGGRRITPLSQHRRFQTPLQAALQTEI